MTKIQWTDATVNFWIGCRKVSDGCKNCYLFRMLLRFGKDPKLIWRTSDATFKAALKWKQGKKIFTNSWSDFFIEDADQWRDEAWEIIKATKQHTWQILTKRPERILEHLPADWGNGYENVWLGVSIENEKNMDRLKLLSEVPAKVKFLSVEPLLEEIDFMKEKELMKNIDWVIVGGESGNKTGKYKFRECKVGWIKRIIDDMKNLDIPVFVKQVGTYLATEMNLNDKKFGGDMKEWPKQIRLRKFPVVKKKAA